MFFDYRIAEKNVKLLFCTKIDFEKEKTYFPYELCKNPRIKTLS